jgi:hypothetical protein
MNAAILFDALRFFSAPGGAGNLSEMGFINVGTCQDEAFARSANRSSCLWGGHVAAAFDADTAAGRNTPRKIAFEAATSEIYEDS